MSNTTRALYALHWWRIGVRAPATLFVAVALVVSVINGATCSSSYTWCWPWLTMPFMIIALIWDAAQYITLCVNKRGIHPGAHIALDFIIFAGLISGGPIDIIDGIFMWPALIAAGIFSILAAILHFVLFVFACVAVHKWRHSRTPHNVVMMQQPIIQTAMPIGAGQGTYATVQAHASLPPPPPGMVYLVPIAHAQQFSGYEPNKTAIVQDREREQQLPESTSPSTQQLSELGSGNRGVD